MLGKHFDRKTEKVICEEEEITSLDHCLERAMKSFGNDTEERWREKWIRPWVKRNKGRDKPLKESKEYSRPGTRGGGREFRREDELLGTSNSLTLRMEEDLCSSNGVLVKKRRTEIEKLLERSAHLTKK